MKVYINLKPEQVKPEEGIGQVVLAQYQYLPSYGIEIAEKPDPSCIFVSHISQMDLPRVDVLHSHGLYWTDLPHLKYEGWHHRINREIAAAARQAAVITTPSAWVGEIFKRDMHVTPYVVPHGIHLEQWEVAGENKGYVLYNKNRESDVCRSIFAWELANRGVRVVSTFAPYGKAPADNMHLVGVQPFDKMQLLVKYAEVYLSTTMETFGIGTIEALASGVPVLGFNWGGTAEIITHKVDGYLVEPDDIDGLLEGYEYIKQHRAEMSEAAREKAKRYDWPLVVGKYAEVYEAVDKIDSDPLRHQASLVITNYNYKPFVAEAIDSGLAQTDPFYEIIIVDDGSKDGSQEYLKEKYGKNPKIKLVFQENQGVSAARNHGLELVKTGFVTCLDADDRLHRDYVRELRPALAGNRGLGIAYTGLMILTPEGIQSYASQWPPAFDWTMQTLPSIPPGNCIHSGAMFRVDMWKRAGGWRQEYAPGEDAEFWVRGLSIGYEARKVSNNPLFEYRGHADSASRTKKYKRIDDRHPWMRDHLYPFAAPFSEKIAPTVNSYARPQVSVIIPVGPGHEKYLPDALNSLKGQTFRGWEAIVIDDTLDYNIINRNTFYPWVRVLKTEHHGAGAARNVGIKAAHAPLVLFLDADDLLLPESLSKMMDAYLLLGGGRYIYGDTIIAGQETLQAKEYTQTSWEMQHSITVLMEREQAQDLLFDETLESWEDWDFFIRAAIKGYCGWRLQEPVLVYRMHSGSRRTKVQDKEAPEGVLGGAVPLNAKGRKILKQLRDKYGEFYTGGKVMGSCCGGGNAAAQIIKIKNQMSQKGETMLPNAPLPDTVRLEYIGDNQAARTFTVHGRQYRGGKNPNDRYVNVLKEDVEKLVSFGLWKIIPIAVPLQADKSDTGPADIGALVDVASKS